MRFKNLPGQYVLIFCLIRNVCEFMVSMHFDNFSRMR